MVVVGRRAAGWQVLRTLRELDIYQSSDVAVAEQRVGERRVAVVTEAATFSYPQVGAWEQSQTVSLCLLPAEPGQAVTCPMQIRQSGNAYQYLDEDLDGLDDSTGTPANRDCSGCCT